MLVTLLNIAYCHINGHCSISMLFNIYARITMIDPSNNNANMFYNRVFCSRLDKVRITGQRIHGANRIQHEKTRLASNTTRTLLALIDSPHNQQNTIVLQSDLPPDHNRPFSCMTCFHARTCMRDPFSLPLARAFVRRVFFLSTPPSTGDTPARIDVLRNPTLLLDNL